MNYIENYISRSKLKGYGKTMKILLIEDDEVMSKFIKFALTGAGYSVDHVKNGNVGLELARVNSEVYDIIVLDVVLPGCDGFEICKSLREENNNVLILMLSERGRTEDKVKGLNVGADDYMAKPFKISELLARIRALQRRQTETLRNHKIIVRNVELDPDGQEVFVSGKLIDLTPIEFRMLSLLIKERGKVLSRSMIIEKVWDIESGDLFSNSINVHIRSLRCKINDSKKNPLIITVRGSGYKFATE